VDKQVRRGSMAQRVEMGGRARLCESPQQVFGQLLRPAPIDLEGDILEIGLHGLFNLIQWRGCRRRRSFIFWIHTPGARRLRPRQSTARRARSAELFA
jgi:hypothetical protein